MSRSRSSLLGQQITASMGANLVIALIELGRTDDAESELDSIRGPERSVLEARLARYRGDYLSALASARTAPGASGQLELGATLLDLGRHDEALDSLDGATGAEAELARAAVHLAAGEPAPATVALDRAERSLAPASDGLTAVVGIRLLLLKAAIASHQGAAGRALAGATLSRQPAAELGSPVWLVRSETCLAVAHAQNGNRWRALRAITRAVEAANRNELDAATVPLVHFQAWRIYSAYGHPRLATPALQTAHSQVVRVASGIAESEYRETYFLDNPEVHRVVAAWKGDPGWGTEVRQS